MAACAEPIPVDVVSAWPLSELNGVALGMSAGELAEARSGVELARYTGYSEDLGGARVFYHVSKPCFSDWMAEADCRVRGKLTGIAVYFPAENSTEQTLFGELWFAFAPLVDGRPRCSSGEDPFRQGTRSWTVQSRVAHGDGERDVWVSILRRDFEGDSTVVSYQLYRGEHPHRDGMVDC